MSHPTCRVDYPFVIRQEEKSVSFIMDHLAIYLISIGSSWVINFLHDARFKHLSKKALYDLHIQYNVNINAPLTFKPILVNLGVAVSERSLGSCRRLAHQQLSWTRVLGLYCASSAKGESQSGGTCTK